jgi:hypothetical protein
MGSGSDENGKKSVLELDDPLRGADEAIKESGIIAMPTVKPPAVPIRERQMTLLDEDLTEQARLASVLIDSTPPQPLASGLRARLSPLDRVPVLAKSIAELGADMREPKTAFVIGFVDGILPLETIVEVTGLPEHETLEILDRLMAQGAIVFPHR